MGLIEVGGIFTMRDGRVCSGRVLIHGVAVPLQ